MFLSNFAASRVRLEFNAPHNLVVAPDGLIYAEAGAALALPPELAMVRRDKAGHVHYHLLARA